MPSKNRPVPAPAASDAIRIRGARQHNLKGLNLEIPRGKITVVTGPSGSGKSSLAFHTLYAEGQRRYVETFSPYVRQFFDRMDKPAVDQIDGIPPAIAIEQKNNVRTTRSTVGTITEINDYLKLLFPRMARGHDPQTGAVIVPDSAESAAAWVHQNLRAQPVLVTFPLSVPPATGAAEFFALLHQQGYLRVLVGDALYRTDDAPPALAATVQVVQDRLTVNPGNEARLREALEAAFALGKGCAAVSPAATPAAARSFTTAWTNPETGFTLRKPTPALFSFNNPLGACPECRGFGRVIGLDLDKTIVHPALSIKQGVIKPFQGERGGECQADLVRNCRERRIDLNTPWEDLDQQTRDWVFYGDRKAHAPLDPEALEELWQSGAWYGVKGFFDWLETKSYKMHVRIFLARYRSYTACPTCRGSRLQPEALCFKIDGKSLPDLWALPVIDLHAWFLERPTPTADPTLKLILAEITNRLAYLDQVGLGYLTLDRPTRTLSGGEVERVNLTTCLGASLTNTLFVLDEPTVGLHPRDIARLTGIMRSLCDKGNTLVVVEHEEAVMRAADELLDIGPGAGQHGGEIVYQGPVGKPGKRGAGGTLPWLSGEKFIAVPAARRPPGARQLAIRGASRHNLRKLDVDIPLGLFVCLTGVSGSGKSTFVHDVLFLNLAGMFGAAPDDADPAPVRELRGAEHLGGVQLVDQSPLARTPRSTPAVFLGAFDPLRQLFCEGEAAKSAGLTPGFFSFNSGEGRCDRCAGNGFEKIEMQFLSDLFVTCPDCNGRRYKASTLDYSYLDRSIADFLDLTVEAAVTELTARLTDTKGKERTLLGKILTALQPLIETGLGYLRLGQPLNTLSGGESQRLKLCQLLAGAVPAATGQLLILDEPTTGLHFSDIARLLGVFQRLVDSGHSLLVIEHNLDVIKSADWILDLGPDAGAHGGLLVASGTPEQVALTDTPTARFLAPVLTAQRGLRAAESPASYRKSKPAAANTSIAVRGARHHNLKNLSLDIPRDQLVVVTGLSGSGKSTLAFDIIFAEGQRRFLDSMSPYARQFAEQLEKPDVDLIAGLPPTVAIEQRVSQGGGKSTVATITEVWHFLRLLYAKTGTQFCPDCQVPVEKQSLTAIEAAIRAHLARGPVSILAPVIRARKGYHTDVADWAARQGFTRLLVDKKFQDVAGFQRLERFKEHDIDVEVASFSHPAPAKGRKTQAADPLESVRLTAAIARALQIGKGTLRVLTPGNKFVVLSATMSCPNCARSFDELDPRLFSFNSPHGWCGVCRGHGLVAKRSRALDPSKFDSLLAAEVDADRALDRADADELVACKACAGSRLDPVGRAVRLQGTAIAELAQLPVDAAVDALAKFSFTGRDAVIARDILPEIRQRLRFLSEVGLGYLQLDRSARTLSGGEAQRIRLAAQLGSNLRGVLYVLDEPTIGLHPRDNVRLLDTLQALLAKGNSLLVVEHDEDTMARADYLLDLGPGAGRLGGEVTAAGTLAELMANPASVTGRALRHPLVHPTRGSRRALPAANAQAGWLRLNGCSANNLKNLNARIPLGRLTVLTGVSGSGKSSLLRGVVAAVFDRTIKRKPYKSVTGEKVLNACYEVDQSPLGKTSRSCPATYVKVFDEIRATFAQLPEARLRGFDASRFSFNTDGGRCPDCNGNGRLKLEMDFLPTTWVPCETCAESRYNPATLAVTYDGRSIGDVLHMTIDEAAGFFAAHPKISRPLQLLADTGLGYLQLGQPSPTLSGGEAQRLKLVSQLIRGRGAKAQLANTTHNIYLIEEPTIGLHLDDVAKLIDVLHRLVDEGHTVVVIEHHTAVIAEADFLVDIGPEAGAHGGTIVAQGTPEEVATSEDSRTAPFLRSVLG